MNDLGVPPEPPASPADALDYVRRLIDQEQKRKESLDQRGVSAITTAAALLAIILSVRTGLADEQISAVSGQIRGALGLISASIGLAISSALLTFSSSPKIKDVKAWARGQAAGSDTPLEHDLSDLGARRRSNGMRLFLISAAQLAQCAVVVVLIRVVLSTL